MQQTSWNFSVMHYSPKWRAYRREFHQFFHQRRVSDYRPITEKECQKLLQRVLDAPNQLSDCLRL